MGACCNGACRRTKPIHIRRSGLTERFYAITRYKEHGGEIFEAQEKHDVTEDVRALIAEAEERGAARVRERVEAAWHPLICATCHGSGTGFGKTADGRDVETDCSDCDGSGGDFFDIEDAVYRGNPARNPERDAASLLAAANRVRAALKADR